jgi:UDP-N-acetylmuramoyl-L-alanyl-D-glutamate--2,6-diaminopimelate ligase
MKAILKILIKNIRPITISGLTNIQVTGVVDDNRKVQQGNLFVAIKGLTVDGHDYIEDAIDKGASVIVGEKKPESSILKKVTYIQVKDSREALSYLCSAWYADPSQKLKVIGVTGTDGKTTTSNIIWWVLNKSGYKAGVVSSIDAKIGNKKYDTGFHTSSPEPPLLQNFLHKMVKAKCEYALLETTSIGLDQARFSGISFSVGVLTNISHEHLDYHKNFECYKQSKYKLFNNSSISVINRDDENYEDTLNYLRSIQCKYITYSTKDPKADFFANDIKIVNYKMIFTVKNLTRTFEVNSQLLGDYNVSNILAAIAVLKHFKIPESEIVKHLTSFPCLSGRLESINNRKNIQIYVDFAHTPNGLKNLLILLSNIKKKNLITIFGSAGARDQSKRPIMGSISSEFSKFTIVTSEDPRNEDVSIIIDEISAGAIQNGAIGIKKDQINESIYNDDNHYILKIPERGEAISYAIQEIAQKGDIVVITGKGHEKTMAYGKTEYPWTDQEAISVALTGGVKKIHRL